MSAESRMRLVAVVAVGVGIGLAWLTRAGQVVYQRRHDHSARRPGMGDLARPSGDDPRTGRCRHRGAHHVGRSGSVDRRGWRAGLSCGPEDPGPPADRRVAGAGSAQPTTNVRREVRPHLRSVGGSVSGQLLLQPMRRVLVVVVGRDVTVAGRRYSPMASGRWALVSRRTAWHPSSRAAVSSAVSSPSAQAQASDGGVDPHAFDLGRRVVQPPHRTAPDRVDAEGREEHPVRKPELGRRGGDRPIDVEPIREPAGEVVAAVQQESGHAAINLKTRT